MHTQQIVNSLDALSLIIYVAGYGNTATVAAVGELNITDRVASSLPGTLAWRNSNARHVDMLMRPIGCTVVDTSPYAHVVTTPKQAATVNAEITH
jgi:hypothetical protein